jgi:hypothetical protein
MQTARARQPRADNPLAASRPQFRLVEPSTAEIEPAESAPVDDDEAARAEYIARLEAAPEPDAAPPHRDEEGRRTVQVSGRPEARMRTRTDAEAADRPRGRKPASPTRVHLAAKPDRVALWAVVLGLFLAFMAAATARGDEPTPAPQPAPHVQIR